MGLALPAKTAPRLFHPFPPSLHPAVDRMSVFHRPFPSAPVDERQGNVSSGGRCGVPTTAERFLGSCGRHCLFPPSPSFALEIGTKKAYPRTSPPSPRLLEPPPPKPSPADAPSSTAGRVSEIRCGKRGRFASPVSLKGCMPIRPTEYPFSLRAKKPPDVGRI